MTLDQKIEKILLDAKGAPVFYCDIRASTDAIGVSLTHSLGRLRKRYVDRLVTGPRSCAIVKPKKPFQKLQNNFKLPEDIWRGWKALGTEASPTHLGV